MMVHSSRTHLARARSQGWAEPSYSPFVGALLVFGAGAAVSFTGLAFRLTDRITAWQFIIFRGLGAFVVMGLFVLVRHRRAWPTLRRSVDANHVVPGVMLGVISAIFIVSLEHASVAFVMGLQTLSPLTAAYFSWVLLGERVSRAVLIATGVALVGVLVMFSATLTDRVSPIGLLAALIPLLFGAYASLIRRADSIDPQVPVVVAGATLVVLGVAGSAIADGFDISAADALIGLFAGGIVLAIPVAVLNHATRVVPAPEVALLLLGEILLAPLWVWMFVDERPTATTLVGGSVILVAVTGLLAWRRRRALEPS